MPSIEVIEDIGSRHRARLKAADLWSCRALLEAGATKRGRRIVAETVGVSESRVLEWVHKADLMRINGISTRYAQLLEAAGVDSIRKLRKRRPAQLHQSLVAEDAKRRKRLVSRLPSKKEVGAWVKQAKKLPQVVK
jgi:predicted flap endonuclease-1-like 5' DNA nuclease